MAEEIKNEQTKVQTTATATPAVVTANEQPKVQATPTTIQAGETPKVVMSSANVTHPAEAPEFATASAISSPTLAANAHPNDVVFAVKYPKDYKGEKTLPEGNLVVSKEVADQFTKLGIGKEA